MTDATNIRVTAKIIDNRYVSDPKLFTKIFHPTVAVFLNVTANRTEFKQLPSWFKQTCLTLVIWYRREVNQRSIKHAIVCKPQPQRLRDLQARVTSSPTSALMTRAKFQDSRHFVTARWENPWLLSPYHVLLHKTRLSLWVQKLIYIFVDIWSSRELWAPSMTMNKNITWITPAIKDFLF